MFIYSNSGKHEVLRNKSIIEHKMIVCICFTKHCFIWYKGVAFIWKIHLQISVSCVHQKHGSFCMSCIIDKLIQASQKEFGILFPLLLFFYIVWEAFILYCSFLTASFQHASNQDGVFFHKINIKKNEWMTMIEHLVIISSYSSIITYMFRTSSCQHFIFFYYFAIQWTSFG